MVTLHDKAIVITGAGRGLGRAYALEEARRGAAVVVNDIDAPEADAVVAEIISAGGRAVAHPADISVAKEATALIERCVTEFSTIDGLVSNAGIGMIDASAPQDQDEEKLRRIFEVHVFGASFCGTAAMRHMLANGRGSIVNITSSASAGTQQLAAYSACKGAVASLTLSWALDLKASGVRVNAVAPMAITRMWNWDLIPEGSVIPAPERLAPERNAGVIVYLLSDAAAAVHGQLIGIRGGGLSLLTHPALVEPVLSRDDWTADAVDEAFSDQLLARSLPLGMSQVSLEVAE